MSLEKEFLYYSNKLQNPQITTTENYSNTYEHYSDDVVYIGGSDCTYLNIKLVMSKELLEEINVVSETLGISPEATLANYLQYGNDLKLVPIKPSIPRPEDKEVDAIYYLDDNDTYFVEDEN